MNALDYVYLLFIQAKTCEMRYIGKTLCICLAK